MMCESTGDVFADPMLFDCDLTENGLASLALKAHDPVFSSVCFSCSTRFHC